MHSSGVNSEPIKLHRIRASVKSRVRVRGRVRVRVSSRVIVRGRIRVRQL